MTLPKGMKKALEEAADKLKTAAERNWAACIRRVFEAWPVQCAQCGAEMEIIAIITDDSAVSKILSYLGQSTEWPVMNPARAPPDPSKDETQTVRKVLLPSHGPMRHRPQGIDVAVDRWDAIQDA